MNPGVIIGGDNGTSNQIGFATIESGSSTLECVLVGGDAGSTSTGPTGTLVIQTGGQLSTNFIDLGAGQSGHGSLVVRGATSKVFENPDPDPNCVDRTHNVTLVGANGTGAVHVAQGAELNNLFLVIGRDPESSGQVTLSSPSSCFPMQEDPADSDCSQLNMFGVADDTGFPAFAQVGRGGTGHLVLERARALISLNGETVEDPAKAGHGVNIAREPGSTGSLTIADQSKFVIEGSDDPDDWGAVQVGRLGTGTLDIAGGSLLQVQSANSFLIAARSPGSTGHIHLRDAGTVLDVEGTVGLSRDIGDNDGGVSVLTLESGTTLNAGEIDAHANATIFVAGTINVVGPFTVEGVLNPGLSPGTAVINGDLTLTDTGLLRLEIVGSGGEDGADKLEVNGDFACNDCDVRILLQNGATIDDIDSSELVVVSGESTGTADIQVVNDEGETVASFEDVAPGSLSVEQVGIDIKPGSDENPINLGSSGVLPVAILSSLSAGFDATNVDPASVQLSSAEIRLRGNGTFQTAEEDVNGDGFDDLVIKVNTEALELSEGVETALLTGQTFAGTAIQGSDLIKVVPEDG